jgi:hypothetical protein
MKQTNKTTMKQTSKQTNSLTPASTCNLAFAAGQPAEQQHHQQQGSLVANITNKHGINQVMN